MFERVLLRRSEVGPDISLGEIAEALLFYQSVHIIIDYGLLNALVEKLGIEGLIRLVSRPNVTAVYCEETLAVRTEKVGVSEFHSYAAITFAGDQESGQLHSHLARLAFVLKRHGLSRRKAHNFAEQFLRRVPLKKFTDNSYVEGGIIKAAKDDLHESEFVQRALRSALAEKVGDGMVSANTTFEVIPNESHFHILTNFDFDKHNNDLRKKDTQHENLTAAHLANEVLTSHADIFLCARSVAKRNHSGRRCRSSASHRNSSSHFRA